MLPGLTSDCAARSLLDQAGVDRGDIRMEELVGQGAAATGAKPDDKKDADKDKKDADKDKKGDDDKMKD